MSGEGSNNLKPDPKKKSEGSYSKIPVFGPSIGGITTRDSESNQKESQTGRGITTIPPNKESRSNDKIKENKEAPRYNYIGYDQDYSIDDSQSYISLEMLKKLAMDAFRAKNYYVAMQYLNKILVKNPGNKEALFFKKKVLQQLEELKH